MQQGTPAEIARRPRTDYVARLVGLNLYRGRAAGHEVRVGPDFTLTSTDRLDGPAFVAFPPSAVALHRDRPDSSARNAWRAVVTGMESHGDQFRVALTGAADGLPLAADLTAAGRRRPRPESGRRGVGVGEGGPDARLSGLRPRRRTAGPGRKGSAGWDPERLPRVPR